MNEKSPLRSGDVVRTRPDRWGIYMGGGIWLNSRGQLRYCSMFTFIQKKKAPKGELERA